MSIGGGGIVARTVLPVQMKYGFVAVTGGIVCENRIPRDVFHAAQGSVNGVFL